MRLLNTTTSISHEQYIIHEQGTLKPKQHEQHHVPTLGCVWSGLAGVVILIPVFSHVLS